MTRDPFRHCEALRGKIRDPETSFFRDFDLENLKARLDGMGFPPDWLRTDEEREATRRAAMRDWPGGDLWIFGYGSLMWDPAMIFDEVRYARVPGYARRFCLFDDKGGRGTLDAPGLMAALDTGPCCDGIAFLIAAGRVEEETERLWRREMIGPAYTPTFVDMTIGDETATALTFTADHAATDIRTDLGHADKVRMIATGAGFLGTSLEYIENLAAHLDALGLEDEEVTTLLHDARAFTP